MSSTATRGVTRGPRRVNDRTGVNFTTRRSRKRKKIQLCHQYLFTLSGSASIKAVHRTLMKLSPGLNFDNIVQAAFKCIGHKSPKRYWWLGCLFFTHLGSCRVKAAHKMLMKLTPSFYFANILWATFWHESILRSFFLLKF